MRTRVAIYARHSTDKQTTSTTDQIASCRVFCEKAGYDVVLIFQDEAVSGASVVNRPGIADLIDAAIHGYFDLIVAEGLSRISRDQGDMAIFFRKMRFLDIGLETVSEGRINELHIGFKGTLNALQLRDLADMTRRGMIASVLKGAIPGGRTYGYDLVRGLDARDELIKGLRKINPGQADTIRWIFRQYAAGASLYKICSDLNRQGIPSPKGGKWVKTTLIGQLARKTGLLRQTLYKGVVTFNRMMFRKNPETGKRQSFVRPESEWISVPVPELAIVDEALFDEVQKLIEGRSSMRLQRRKLAKVLPEEDKRSIAKARKRRRKKQAPSAPRSSLYIFS
ncbi:MAG: recombinase family protein, partial [Alphaproteobacteria bacterium]|nr:recombinase family protein [Alphaproteobacteria bacterium]